MPICCGADPHGFVQKDQGIVVPRGTTAAIVSKNVFDSLRTNELSKSRMGEATVHMFEEFASYDKARENIRYLEQLDFLDQALLQRIQKISTENTQIRDNTIFPERINALLRKHGFEGSFLTKPVGDEIPF